MAKKNKYMTAKELVDYLPDIGSIWTVYRWTTEKRIPYIKIGKKLFFDKNEIDQWNNDNRPKQVIR